MGKWAGVLMAAALLAAPLAQAASGYAGVAASLVEADDYSGGRFSDGSLGLTTDETEDETFRVFGGLEYGRYFALELGYVDLGTASFTGQSDGSGFRYAAGPVEGEIAVKGFSGGLIGKLPIGDEVGITARAGLLRWSSESGTRDSGGPVTASEDKGTDAFYGLGVQLRVVESVWLVFDYSIYKLNLSKTTTFGAGTYGNHDLKALSLGVLVPFGR